MELWFGAIVSGGYVHSAGPYAVLMPGPGSLLGIYRMSLLSRFRSVVYSHLDLPGARWWCGGSSSEEWFECGGKIGKLRCGWKEDVTPFVHLLWLAVVALLLTRGWACGWRV